MLKRSSSLPQEFPRSQGWPLSRFLHTFSEGEEFSTYRAPPPLSIQAWKPLTSVDPEPRRPRGPSPLGSPEDSTPPTFLPLNLTPHLPAPSSLTPPPASQ